MVADHQGGRRHCAVKTALASARQLVGSLRRERIELLQPLLQTAAAPRRGRVALLLGIRIRLLRSARPPRRILLLQVLPLVRSLVLPRQIWSAQLPALQGHLAPDIV